MPAAGSFTDTIIVRIATSVRVTVHGIFLILTAQLTRSDARFLNFRMISQPNYMSNTIIIYSLQRRIATILQIR